VPDKTSIVFNLTDDQGIRAASAEELASVPGMNPRAAAQVLEYLGR